MNRMPEPRFSTLDDWLNWQDRLHPSKIELGLERVGRVADRLQCRNPAPTVISIAGTNGKGSTVSLLEAILVRAGYSVGSYTSPHLFRYNERLRIDGEPVGNHVLCEAFARVDRARGEDSLTYFEFGTLAALDILKRAGVEVALLEVGLGGRLDAVNIVDADAALVTNVGLDHTEWLGPDREAIGREKAGIFRPGKAAVCAESDPPASLAEEAARVGVPLQVLGRDFKLREAGRGWHWQGLRQCYRDLPRPALAGAHQLANAAGVFALLESLEERLPLPRAALEAGLRRMRLAGRIQRIPGRVEQVLDVSHNAEAALALADTLRNLPLAGKTHALIGMMKDKDIAAFAQALQPLVCAWYAVELNVERAATARQLAQRIVPVAGSAPVVCGKGMSDALQKITDTVQPGDRILVCGSFHTVAEWSALAPNFE